MKEPKIFTQKQRRVRVVLYYLSLVLYWAFLPISQKVLPSGIVNSLFLSVWVVFVMVGTGLLRSLGYKKNDLLELAPRLDEWQQLTLYKAHRIAFYVTFVLIVAVTVTTIIVAANAHVNSVDGFRTFSPVLVGLLILTMVHYTMPAAMIVWLEPDPIAEDFAPSHPNKENNHELA